MNPHVYHIEESLVLKNKFYIFRDIQKDFATEQSKPTSPAAITTTPQPPEIKTSAVTSRVNRSDVTDSPDSERNFPVTRKSAKPTTSGVEPNRETAQLCKPLHVPPQSVQHVVQQATQSQKSDARPTAAADSAKTRASSAENSQMPTFSTKPPSATQSNVFSTKPLSSDTSANYEQTILVQSRAPPAVRAPAANVFSTFAALEPEKPATSDAQIKGAQLRQNAHDSPPTFSGVSSCDVSSQARPVEVGAVTSSKLEWKEEFAANRSPSHNVVTSQHQVRPDDVANIDRAKATSADDERCAEQQRFAMQSGADVTSRPSLLQQHMSQRRSLELDPPTLDDDDVAFDDVTLGDEPPRNMFSLFDERSSRLQQDGGRMFPADASRESGVCINISPRLLHLLYEVVIIFYFLQVSSTISTFRATPTTAARPDPLNSPSRPSRRPPRSPSPMTSSERKEMSDSCLQRRSLRAEVRRSRKCMTRCE